MKLPNCLKNLNSRKGNEKGSVTLFVLIAMLFFLMIGMMIFIINMNTETSQKRDVEKIKSEYSSGTSETDLEQMYQEAKARQLATFLIKLIDSNGNIYNNGEWVNKKWLDENRMPLKIVPEFPAGVTNIDVTIIDETVAGRPSVHVKDTDELKRMTIGAANDKQYTIVNNVDTTNQIKVNIDTTLPTVTKPAGGTIWKGTAEETVTGTDAGGTVTITASDNLSGVKELKYIINNSPEAPSADAEWTTVEGATAQVTINNEKDLGVYYIHIIATDVAGNASEVVTSKPYYVKQANYKITTTTGTTYSETLKDAAEKPGAMVIKVLNTFTDEVPATIAQNVTIDTNGKTLTMANTITVANGATATFVGTGTIQRNVADGVRGDLITNNGTVVVGVENSDNGPTLTSKDVVINNGTVTVYSGNIASQGQSSFAPNAGIYSKTINVYGGNITNDSGAYGIVINLAGICNITGGRITGNKAICPQNGTLNISGSATIEGNAAIGSSASTNHNYTLNISGGVIRSTSRFAINADTPETNITITGGTITGATDGISITGANSTLTIGNNSNALDRTAPVITGTTGKGIKIAGETSTLNYYDGTIIGKTKGTKTFNGREVAFSVKDDTTVNFLTETEEGNVTRYYRPYTRENEETHLFETVLEKQVNVTFNPGEGATVAESNRNVLTNVEYKEKAEDATIVSLPTPTKTGYTFKGWNGKNLFDGTYSLEGRYLWNSGKTAQQSNFNVSNFIDVKPNTSYVLSATLTSGSLGGVGSICEYDANGEFIIGEAYIGRKVLIFTTSAETKKIKISYKTNESNYQLEEGTVATAYEPYWIEDTTKVVQDQDHTLNAIWEANPYTVTLNAGDGTIDDGDDGWTRAGDNKTATKDITYDSNYGTLPTASRTGYTFDGWFTEATGGTKITNTTKMQTASEQSLYAHWTANNYTVTAHANGGAIASTTGWEGTGESATKQVTYDSAYGTLPEATKTGYTLKGWNGKNKFDESKYTKIEDYNISSNYKWAKIYLKPNTEYYVNIIRYNGFDGKNNGHLIINSTPSTESNWMSVAHEIGPNVSLKKSYTTEEDGLLYIGYYANTTNQTNLDTIWENTDVQIEEGTTATPYEPYYITSETPVTTASNHDINAMWEANKYTVTLNAGDGTIDAGDDGWTRAGDNKTATKDITYDSDYGTLPKASRTGYEFDGWFTEATGGTKITDTTKMQTASAVTLYPHWTANNYTIHFNANGGTGTMADEAMTYDVEKALTKNTFTKTGYEFQGWSQANEGFENALLYSNDAEKRAITREFLQYTDLAPYFDKYGTNARYRLEFDIKSTDITNRDKVAVYFQNGRATRYSFKTIIGEEQALDGGNRMYWVTASTEWTHKMFDFKINRGNNNETQAQLAFYGLYDTGNYPIVKNVRLYIVPDYTDEEVVKNLTAEKNGEVTLYANWKAKEYTVTANANGGAIASTTGWSGTGESATKQVTYDSPYGTMPEVSKTGYTFKGWQYGMKIDDTTGKKWASLLVDNRFIVNNLKPNTRYKIEYDVTLNEPIPEGYSESQTIQWGMITLRTGTSSYRHENITQGAFYQEAGSNYEVGRKYHITGIKTMPADLSTAVLTCYTARAVDGNGNGYTLNGTISNMVIYEDEVGYGMVDQNTIVKVPEDHTITAVWDANPYTVTLNAGDGTIDAGDDGWTRAADNKTATKDITYDSNYGTLPTASRTGYTFDGWFTEATGGTKITNTTKMQTASEQSLYAHWTANNYTVTAHASGGEIDSTTGWEGTGESATKQVTYDSAYGTLPEVTKTGYTLKGWQYGVQVPSKSGKCWVKPLANNDFVINNLKANTTYKVEYDVTLNEPIPEGYSASQTVQWGNITYQMGTSPYTYKVIGNNILYQEAGSDYEVGRKYHIIATTNTPEDLSSTVLLCYTARATNSNGDGYIINGEISNIVFYEAEVGYGIVDNDTIVKIDQDHTLNAIWEANKYTVTLNAGEGTIDAGDDDWARAADNKTATKDITYDSDYGTLPKASRTGYEFDGWFTEATGGTKITDTTKMQTASAVTLYPHWTANNYTITVDANGGTIPATEGWEGTGETATKQVTFDSQYGSLPTPTRAGYEFQGWKINGEGDLITNNSTVTTASNHTLKAVWKDIEKTKWTIKLHKPNPITPSVFQIFEN